MENLIEIKNELEFDDQLKNNKLLLVDFHGVWCNPCKMITPLIKEIAESNIGIIRVCKVDVDENPEITSRYKIRTIPTLLVFNNGELVRQKSGAMPKSQILDLFKDQLI